MQALGREFELMATAVKPYPSCRYGHAGIDAALALRAEHHFDPAAIEAVTLGLSRSGMLLIGEPAAKKADPRNVVDGQFSGPFVIACALATGAMGWDSYRLLEDPTIRALLPKITCVHDPEIEAEFPANMSANLTVRAGGRNSAARWWCRRASPPTSSPRRNCAPNSPAWSMPVLGAERGARLADAVLAIDRTSDVAALMRLAAPMMAARLAGD